MTSCAPYRPLVLCLLTSLVLPALLTSCAAEREARVSDEAPVQEGPSPTSAAAPDEALGRQLLDRARQREARRGARAWACLVEGECDPPASDARAADRQDLELALEVLRQTDVARAAERLAFRTAARLALEEAVAEHEVARAALEDALVLHHGAAMPFAFGDLPLALAQAAPAARAALLASAQPVVEQRSAVTPSAAEARARVAERSGRSSAELLALRSGLDERELRALVDDVLGRTSRGLPELPAGPADVPALLARHQLDLEATSWRRGALVAAFGGRRAGSPSSTPQCVVVDPPRDVRLVEGAQTPPSLARSSRACASAAARLPEGPWDPAWVHVVATLARDSAWLSRDASRERAAKDRQRAALALEARRLAVEVRALLDGVEADRQALDALATTWTSPGRAAMPGASALLALDASGAAVDALVAVVIAAALDNAFASRHGPGWAASAESAAAVEGELDALAAVWHDEGPRGTLRALGLTKLDASPLVARLAR